MNSIWKNWSQKFSPGEDNDAEDVADDADGHEDVGEDAVGVPVNQVDEGLLFRCRSRFRHGI